MRTYIMDGLKIEIGAELVAVHHGGERIIPKERKNPVKDLIKEFWNNSYFRKRTKTQIGIKLAEIASKFISGAAIYETVKKELKPYLPQIIEALKHVDWPHLAFCVDMGFALGVLTTAIGINLKRKLARRIKRG